MTTRARGEKVAIFIDGDNISQYQKEILHTSRQIGIIECIKLFGKTNSLKNSKWHDYKKTFPVEVFEVKEHQKNVTDFKLFLEAIVFVFKHPNVHNYVIVSNDGDFFPLLQELDKIGKKVTVISTRDKSPHLPDSVSQINLQQGDPQCSMGIQKKNDLLFYGWKDSFQVGGWALADEVFGKTKKHLHFEENAKFIENGIFSRIEIAHLGFEIRKKTIPYKKQQNVVHFIRPIAVKHEEEEDEVVSYFLRNRWLGRMEGKNIPPNFPRKLTYETFSLLADLYA